MLNEQLRTGSGTPARLSCYARPEIVKASAFPQEWFDTTATSLKIARSGLPVIVPVTEFRDTIGSGLTNIVGGADVGDGAEEGDGGVPAGTGQVERGVAAGAAPSPFPPPARGGGELSPSH